MKFIALAFLFGTLGANAQGLVGIQNYSGDFQGDEPLTWSLTTRGGYDHLDYNLSAPGFDSFESWNDLYRCRSYDFLEHGY
jgi:hypothetical protein